LIRQPAFWCVSVTVEITLLPLYSVCTRALAEEPASLIDSTVSVKSSIVFNWLSMLFWQLADLFSWARNPLASTCSQMSRPLPELASLASRLSVEATSALVPV